MVINSRELLERVEKKGLVENLCERELKNPEGPGFDLRAGEFFRIEGDGFLGIDERKTPKSISIETDTLTINPGEYYLVKTMERVNMDTDTFAMVYPRSTFFRSGLQLLSGKISPGYHGNLTFGIANLGPCEFTIEKSARIAFITFFEVKDGEESLSRGQWRGGRVSAEEKETQV